MSSAEKVKISATVTREMVAALEAARGTSPLRPSFSAMAARAIELGLPLLAAPASPPLPMASPAEPR